MQASTTSPVVIAPRCQSEIAQASKPMVSTTVMSAWMMRSRSRYQRLRWRAVISRSMVRSKRRCSRRRPQKARTSDMLLMTSTISPSTLAALSAKS